MAYSNAQMAAQHVNMPGAGTICCITSSSFNALSGCLAFSRALMAALIVAQHNSSESNIALSGCRASRRQSGALSVITFG